MGDIPNLVQNEQWEKYETKHERQVAHSGLTQFCLRKERFKLNKLNIPDDDDEKTKVAFEQILLIVCEQNNSKML